MQPRVQAKTVNRARRLKSYFFATVADAANSAEKTRENDGDMASACGVSVPVVKDSRSVNRAHERRGDIPQVFAQAEQCGTGHGILIADGPGWEAHFIS
jgi:hypothetical protein